ncbi:hypothetical protein B0H17DRAFT_1129369 [Mycena rosella]|uniref:Uncharacterized protein n=1 Tax=Mycena rosella TaxID=1033263 RepID=A0AAD7DUK2_MYCRO|nr:hypothetical protein B0H17DRAFT_1129369 [Mycena rosella]
MTNSKAEKIAKGPSQQLITRITHLRDLLRNLPAALPKNPPHSLYGFHFDADRLEMGGYFAAAGHALEVSFETHLLRIQGRPIRFSERGERHEELDKFLRKAVKEMTPGERTTFAETWIEPLIAAAAASGAMIPARKRKDAPEAATDTDTRSPKRALTIDPCNSVVLTTSTLPALPSSATASSITAGAIPSLPSSSSASSQDRQLVGNPKQRGLDSFGWKKASPVEMQKYWSKVTDDGAERRQEMLETKQQKDDRRKERERDLARLRKQRQRERAKANKPDTSENATTALMRGAKALSTQSDIPDLASLSRPSTQGWKTHRTGTSGGVIQAPTKKVF